MPTTRILITLQSMVVTEVTSILENTFECGCNAGWEPTNCAFAESDDSMACSPEILAEGFNNVDEYTHGAHSTCVQGVNGVST